MTWRARPDGRSARLRDRCRRPRVGWRCLISVWVFVSGLSGLGQVDPFHRNLLQLGYDQPAGRQGPHGIYAYYYYNDPVFFGTNRALRLAIAPAYLDGEVGFREVLFPYTDVGVGFYGGAYGDNY